MVYLLWEELLFFVFNGPLMVHFAEEEAEVRGEKRKRDAEDEGEDDDEDDD